MWILMLETYQGGIGLFTKGQRLDLPDDIVKRLPAGCYKKTCAPWEEHKDKNSVEMVQAKTKAHESKIFADLAQDKADKAKAAAEKIVPVVSALQAESDDIGAKAKEAMAKFKQANQKANKSGASEGDKKTAKRLNAEAWLLARSHERRDLEFQKAHGQLQVALAEQGLLQLDADQAKRNADAAAKALEKLVAKIAADKEKARAEAEAKAKAEAQAKAKAEAEAKAKAEAEAEAKAKARAKAKAEAEAKVKAEAQAEAKEKARIEAEARAEVEAEMQAGQTQPETDNVETKSAGPKEGQAKAKAGKSD